MSDCTPYTISRVTWRGIEIDVCYCKDWLGSTGTDHIEIKSDGRVQLPITDTGYKSLFMASEDLIEHGTACQFVLGWLDAASLSETWTRKEDAARQLSLF